MKDFFVCFCKECKVNCNTHYVRLLKDELTGNVYCFHTWNNKISKHKVNDTRSNEKNKFT